MTSRLRRFAALALASALALPLPAKAQSDPAAMAQVQQLAPQLLAFAGSAANFQSLVNGLSQGLPVTLVTLLPSGFTQTVTFSPAAALSAPDIARTLEAARQQLIARGVATPTGEQIAVSLVGGTLTAGATQATLPGLLPQNASAGGSQPAVAVDLRVTPLPQSTSASVVTGTSNTVVPGTSNSLFPGTSNSTATGTSNSIVPGAVAPVVDPATGQSNGPPSPAAIMQQRR